ncbi:MAG: adenylosuccinate lyase [Candidatus Eremiobacteraeota bacterium]|nr:adenylosuccinate lyase [Candidatus Eremiobacteraeota bacterium]MBV8366130.1 adenylosuccinate lyase [Candidatus Eremiobacteraeota bacterium]
MRALFSEQTKRRMWRRMWLGLAQAQARAALVTPEEIADLRRYVDAVDIDAAHKIEEEIHHDLMAELRVYASQARVGGGKLHLGATSMDIEDNVETARMKVALSMLCGALRSLLDAFAEKVSEYAGLTCMAYTHLQAAEPTTLGYRMSLWAHDFYLDYENLKCLAGWLPSKGLRGAVGTSASYAALLDGSGVSPEDIEREVLGAFDLTAGMITGQTYSRRLDYVVITSLAALAASASKFAFDVRILASSPFGELGEPFGAKQVGSSAMPFKRNPIMSERICSLARLLNGNATVAWQNAADNLLERTLDDSANRRSVIAEAFLAADEIVALAERVVKGLRVDEARIAANLARFGPFAATEAILMAAGRRGADRQALHERLRELSMTAWEALESGEKNPLADAIAADPAFAEYIEPQELRTLMDPARHTGLAEQRARLFAEKVRSLEKPAPLTLESIVGPAS